MPICVHAHLSIRVLTSVFIDLKEALDLILSLLQMFGMMYIRNKYLDQPGVEGLRRDEPRVEEEHDGLNCQADDTGDDKRLQHP